MKIINLLKVIAVNIEESIPRARVTEKPFTGPLQKETVI